jgi:hypothetical protein
MEDQTPLMEKDENPQEERKQPEGCP